MEVQINSYLANHAKVICTLLVLCYRDYHFCFILRSFHTEIGARGSLFCINFVVIFIIPCRQMVFSFFHILPNSSFLITVINSSLLFLKREMLRFEKEREEKLYWNIKICTVVLKSLICHDCIVCFCSDFSFPLKRWSFLIYCCMYWQKRSYIIIHLPSALVCENLLYQTFLTDSHFFLGLYTWMSSSQKWWYQSFKYGNDWHLINIFMCTFNHNVLHVLEKFHK